MTIFTFSFAKSIEAKLARYAASKKNAEIFVALFGKVRGVKGGIDFRISQLLPMPNEAKKYGKDPKMYCYQPPNYRDIVRETEELEKLQFIGTVHSHPGECSRKSKMDIEFALSLAEDEGSILMGIIGTKNIMRMWRVSDRRIMPINGKTEIFKIAMKEY